MYTLYILRIGVAYTFICTLDVCRILTEVIPELKSQAGNVVWHIPHKYQKEMEKKSHVVKIYCTSIRAHST